MTTFKDGPAKGKTLMLHRAAMFLRVTEAAGKFDALDQPDDMPTPQETLYAYQTTGPTGEVHINMGRKGGGFYPIVEYTLCKEQPTDGEMRSLEKWHQWCKNHAPSTGELL